MKPSSIERFMKERFKEMDPERQFEFLRWALVNWNLERKKTVEIDTAAH